MAIDTRAVQEIEGFTVDIAFDFDKIQADISFTAMDSLEDDPRYNISLGRAEPQRRLGTGAVIPGTVIAAVGPTRQSGERPEWTLSSLITYTPNDRWVFALNPRLQGREYAYAGTIASQLVDANGNRVVPDQNFGNYFVLNGSIQYFLRENQQHRILLRGVNLLDEQYFERGAAGASQTLNRAVVRGEVTQFNREFYTNYGWNGKPRSAWVQYEYRF